jgi:hypothetical protein
MQRSRSGQMVRVKKHRRNSRRRHSHRGDVSQLDSHWRPSNYLCNAYSLCQLITLLTGTTENEWSSYHTNHIDHHWQPLAS